MASFIDKIPQFNPYVQQLPVEAMVQVGMEKQKRYDEGIQRIQTQIDNVAGLPIIRDVDKQHLQSKINELGSKLKSVASADFSNYQLVNSVGSMANQIEKDPYIQSAVSSTARYRKGLEEMEKARSEGKSSPSNDWDFNNQASRWLNGDIKSTFNGNYQQYTNYKKNALEIIKSITKDESITEDAFTFDKDGNIVLADAITRKKVSGISPEKIQQALMAGLSPSDWKQMEIDGRYNYSNISNEAFGASINNSYTQRKKAFADQKRILQNALSKTNSLPEKNKINERINDINKAISGVDNEYSGISDLLNSGNIEAAKARLHTANFVNGFSKAFSFTETSQTYEDSPLVNVSLRRADMEQDWKKFTMQFEQAERHFKMNYDLKKEKMDREAKKDEEAIRAGAFPIQVNQADLPSFDMAKFISDVNSSNQAINNSDETFIKRLGKDKEWLDDQYDAWLDRPTGVDPLIADHFRKTETLRRDNEAKMKMATSIEKEITEKYGDIYKSIPTTAKPVSFAGYTYSPKELVDFNSKISKYRYWPRSVSNKGGGGEMIYKDELAQKELSPKELELYNLQKKRETAKTPIGQHVIDALVDLNIKVNVPYEKTLSEKNKETNKRLTERLSSSQGVQYAIPAYKPELREMPAGLMVAAASVAESQKGKLPHSPDFDVTTARKIAADPNAIYKINVIEGTSTQEPIYEIIASGKDGETTKFRITEEQKRVAFGTKFESSPGMKRISPYLEQIRRTGGYTTAIDGKGETDKNNAYLKSIDFPAVNTYGLSGNIISPDGGQSFLLQLNIFDPKTKKTYPNNSFPSKLISAEQMAETLNTLNDQVIYSMISGTSATAGDMNSVKNDATKPF